MSTLIEANESTCIAPLHILNEVLVLENEINENRRWFHAHPELSFQEVNTAAKVVELLRSYGIDEIYEQVGRTGVVAMIRGAQQGPCIALRADMDALPVTETASVDYKSQNEGVMHACGHDGHMAGLLAAAKILFAQRSEIKGCVKLIFQPAEEGYAGAKEMINDGCLGGEMGPEVDSIYGIHLWSFGPLGDVGCTDGPIMAASDTFNIEVRGKGGHGAAPHGTVDAIVEAASLVTSLQTIISRNKDPQQSGVLSIGTINGGYARNVIADKVHLCGTCRSFTPETQDLIESRMKDVCCGVAQTFGGEIDLNYKRIYPPTVNAYPEYVTTVQKAAAKIVGDERCKRSIVTMGAEDFSFFLEKKPGCFFFVGCALPGECRPHHKSVFDFDERGMLISSSIFVQIIRDVLM